MLLKLQYLRLGRYLSSSFLFSSHHGVVSLFALGRRVLFKAQLEDACLLTHDESLLLVHLLISCRNSALRLVERADQRVLRVGHEVNTCTIVWNLIEAEEDVMSIGGSCEHRKIIVVVFCVVQRVVRVNDVRVRAAAPFVPDPAPSIIRWITKQRREP